MSTNYNSSNNRHHHLLACSVAGVLSIAYYCWKNNQNERREKRKDGDANVLYNDGEWDSLLRHYNQMAGVVITTEKKQAVTAATTTTNSGRL